MHILMKKPYGLQMTQSLTDFLNDFEHKKRATQIGTDVHAKMQCIVVDTNICIGDSEIVEVIKNHQDLKSFFTASAQTEVPIAGIINGRFVSRRMDRLLINNDTKTINFIDYKTDTDKTVFIDKYKHQLKEYAELLRSAYPDYKINGYILWLHDWALDKII